MANQPGAGENLLGANPAGVHPFGPPEVGKHDPDNKKPGDDKFSPVVVALQKKLNESENDKRKLQEENARLRTAPAAPKKDTGPKEDKIPHPNVEEAFNTETRVPTTRKIVESALGRTFAKFLPKWTESGPHTKLGMSAEIREKGWLRKLAQIPILGWLAPAGLDSFKGGLQKGFYDKLATVGGAIGAGKDILLASVSPALQVGLIGGLARGAVDTIRWTVMKESTMRYYARKLADRSGAGHMILDEASGIWNTVMGDRADIAQLIDLNNDFKSGVTAEKLMMDKSMMLNLIKSGYNAKLQKFALERIASTSGVLTKLNEKERLHLQNIDTAYEVVEKLFDEGFTPAEKAEFLQNELPQYLQRKEVVNHLKAMGKGAVYTGLKTGMIGMAASVFGTLYKTGLLGDIGLKISGVVKKGYTGLLGYATDWYNQAALGVQGQLDKLPFLKNLQTAPAVAGGAAVLPPGGIWSHSGVGGR